MQGFVNLKVRQNQHLQRNSLPRLCYRLVIQRKSRNKLIKVNEIGKSFNYFIPFESIFEKAEKAKQVISLGTQFGEGWLISGEILSFASQRSQSCH